MTIKVRTLFFIIAALVLLVVVSIFIDAHPGNQSPNTPTLDREASSTLSQALQTARWIQKEYPPLKN
ncbi:MAG: hypothetical protein KGI73_01335 [Patescibacteria group bacterium]|nr:hypothetical protein [Patescibacteria group bacterium]